MQIEIPQDQLEKMAEKLLNERIVDSINRMQYDIKNEAETQFRKAFLESYWGDKKFKTSITDEIKKIADEKINKEFESWFNSKLKDAFRHKINDFIKENLQKELERACKNIRVAFRDEDKDTEKFFGGIIDDMSQGAYESGCMDGYNSR